MDKQRAVKVHFNRINMQRGDSRVWTVHTSRACHQVERVEIGVPLVAEFKPQAAQPRAYFRGVAHVQIVKTLIRGRWWETAVLS